MKIKLFTASSEIGASIIKGALENSGIEANIGPGINSLSLQSRNRGPNVPYDIFVEEDKLETALGILKESGWLAGTK